MEQDPIGNDARDAIRQRRLGVDAECLLCGYTEPEGLIKVHQSLLEKHHIAGRANDAQLTAWLCRNCHAEVTESYRKEGVPLNASRSVPARVLGGLKGLGIFSIDVGRACRRWVSDSERWLDEHYPDWRDED